MIVTRAANSHQKSMPFQPRLNSVAMVMNNEYANATTRASAIRAIMPGRLAFISCQPVVRNTRPPVKNRTVPKTAGMRSISGNDHMKPNNICTE